MSPKVTRIAVLAVVCTLLLGAGRLKDGERLPRFVFENWDGAIVTNESFLGRTTIVVPTFAKCVFACPMVTFLLTELDKELGAPEKIRYLHVSVNPRDDTAEEIMSHFRKHDIEPAIDRRWLFVNAPEENIQEFLDDIGVEVSRRAIEDATANLEPKGAEETAPMSGILTEHTIRVFVVGPDGDILASFDTYFWNDKEMRHALRFSIEPSTER